MTSLWPPRNLVADSTTRSAPSSSGRHTYGEAKVLSTMYVAPCSWASLGEAPRGRSRPSSGWRSSRRRRPGSVRRRWPSPPRSWSVMSTNVDLDAEPRERVDQLRPGRAVHRGRGDDPVAGPQLRGERGMDGAHPRGEGDAGLAAGELRVGGAEGRGRRVGDAAVGVAGPRVARRRRRARPHRPR